MIKLFPLHPHREEYKVEKNLNAVLDELGHLHQNSPPVISRSFFLLCISRFRRFKRKTNIRNETEEKVITIESGSAAVAGAQTQVQVLGSGGEEE